MQQDSRTPEGFLDHPQLLSAQGMELAALECKEKDEWPEDGQEDLEDP